MRNRKSNRRNPEGSSFWQSYSDMMAALLLVFVLIIATATYSYEDTREKFEQQRAEFEAQKSEFEEAKKRFDEQDAALQDMTAKAEKQEAQIEEILGVREDIVQRMLSAFENAEIEGLTVDKETGAITFNSQILFEFNEYALKPEAKKFLKDFFNKYFEIILDKEFEGYIGEVIIEGHTDSVGVYDHNLELSQQRAYVVAQYCIGDNSKMFTGEKLKRVRNLVTANGRADNDLIYKDDAKTIVDDNRSRRVEIKFRLTADEMIQSMEAIFGGK